MELEGSIPNSQELSTRTYPEPDQSSPHHHNLSLTSKSALYKLLTFHVPSLIYIFRRLGHLSKESVQVRGSGQKMHNNIIFKARVC
jgi:hypothetical protein